jgi:hypothetical protein
MKQVKNFFSNKRSRTAPHGRVFQVWLTRQISRTCRRHRRGNQPDL